MKVVILCGGLGTRLGLETKTLPKPMVKIAGKPVLESIITKAKHEGFTNITISINYLGSIIEKYFGNGKKFGVNISYIKETKPLGTAGSIKYLSNNPKKYPIILTLTVIHSFFQKLLIFHCLKNPLKDAPSKLNINPFFIFSLVISQKN